MSRERKSAIDLFSGCGGLTLGLKKAGFDVLAAVENNELAAATYANNHKRVRLIKSDIQLVNLELLSAELSIQPGQLDLLAGCPPCQGFSSLRTMNGGREINEPMNDLIFEFLRFVEFFLPKAIMLENVPGLYTDERLTKVKEKLVTLGYRPKAKVLDAQDYGVPQRRRRLVMLAIRGKTPKFAEVSRYKKSVSSAIKRLQPPGSSTDPLHNYRPNTSDRVQQIIKAIPKDGGSRNQLPNNLKLKCHLKSDGFKDVYGRMAWAAPAPTITGGCINPSKGRFLHPEQDRPITLREASLLQGFPINYRFDNSRGRFPTAQLIGNAFPPKFAEIHAREIHKLI